ncbi:MAG TPA: 50S ribosomal protein L25 [Gemmatimonadetes bacterium]|nr:50S ribosomal protein L25 [Gemmatimonadota bacterium]|tara:strand:- start:85 stop:771 length:687 start_codon:yes stop_codon:yes gene_type:complete
MSTEVILSAEKREGVRKGANRKLRANGRVPAILYGKDAEPALLSVDAYETERLFQQISVENTIIELKVEGDRTKIQALVREVQVEALRPDLVHIDFYKIQKGVRLEVDIPVELSGIPNGVRNDGGVLEQLIHEIPVRCLPDQIPESIEIDVTDLDLQSSLHVSDLAIPEGIEMLMDLERTLCVVSVPRVIAEPEVAESVGTEVIGDETTDTPEAEERGRNQGEEHGES